MFLSRWTAQRRLTHDVSELRSRGAWDNTFESAELLLRHLAQATFRNYTLEVAEATTLSTQAADADRLAQRLRLAAHTMHERAFVQPDKTIALLTQDRTLDQFLLDIQSIPIRPDEAVRVYRQWGTELFKELRSLETEQDKRMDYYRRQYHALMGDFKAALAALLKASDKRLDVP